MPGPEPVRVWELVRVSVRVWEPVRVWELVRVWVRVRVRVSALPEELMVVILSTRLL